MYTKRVTFYFGRFCFTNVPLFFIRPRDYSFRSFFPKKSVHFMEVSAFNQNKPVFD